MFTNSNCLFRLHVCYSGVGANCVNMIITIIDNIIFKTLRTKNDEMLAARRPLYVHVIIRSRSLRRLSEQLIMTSVLTEGPLRVQEAAGSCHGRVILKDDIKRSQTACLLVWHSACTRARSFFSQLIKI